MRETETRNKISPDPLKVSRNVWRELYDVQESNQRTWPHEMQEDIETARIIAAKRWTGAELGDFYARYLASHPNPIGSDMSGVYIEAGIGRLLRSSLGESIDGLPPTPEYMSERKAFVEAVVAYAAALPRGHEASSFTGEFYEELCSFSPSILDDIGDVGDSLDLTGTISSVPEMALIYTTKAKAVAYELARCGDPETASHSIKAKLVEAAPDQQLRMLRILRSVAGFSRPGGHHAVNNGVEIVRSALVESEGELPGLASKLATYMHEEVGRTSITDNVDDDSTQSRGSLMGNGQDLRDREKSLRQAIKLEAGYGATHIPSHVAKGVVGARDRWGTITALAELDNEPGEIEGIPQKDQNLLEIIDMIDSVQPPPPEQIERRIQGMEFDSWTKWKVSNLVASIKYPEVRHRIVKNLMDLLSPDATRQSVAPQPLEAYLADHSIEADSETISLFQEMHHPDTGTYLERQMNIRLEDLTLPTQLQFMKYAATADKDTFARLIDAVSCMEAARKQSFIDNFLALEFGSDYGDSLLNIAEQASAEQSGKIFETINSFRERSAQLAGWFHDHDPEFANDFKKALDERLVDSLVALEEIVGKGSLRTDVAPHRHTEGYESDGRFMIEVDSLDEGIEILQSLEKDMVIKHDVITAPDVVVSRVVEPNDQYMMYRFSSKTNGEVLLYVRPEGAKGYDKNIEYGNRDGVEASISFISNPEDPFHLRYDKDPRGVSLRFDRQGYRVDESPFSDDRDPTRDDGSISVDISSGMGDVRYMPVKIGRFIAAGNIMRAAKTGGFESLHHNTNHFDQQRYGTAEGFSKLAVYIMHMAEAMIAIQERGNHSSQYRSIPRAAVQASAKVAA